MKNMLGLYEKALPPELDWRERSLAARSLGFQFLEISIDEDPLRERRLYNMDFREELKRTIYETQMPVNSMCLSVHRKWPFGSRDAAVRKRAQEIMDLAIEFAFDCGIRLIQLAGYDVYYEEHGEDTDLMFKEGMKRALESAAARQVMLAIEIMDTPYINSITRFLELRSELESPWLTVYPDLGNLTAWGNGVYSQLESGFLYITAVHLKDTLAVTRDFPGRFKNVPFGEGCVDFAGCFEKLRELNYTGPYLMEMWAVGDGRDAERVNKARSYIEEQYAVRCHN